MIELTTEQQLALDSANGVPPVVIDRRTSATYVLIRTATPPQLGTSEIPEGIRRSRAALRQALPELLAHRRNRNKWVCYHLEEQIGIGNDYAALIGECNRRNISDGEYTIERIAPGAGSEEEIEIETPFV